MLNDEVLGGRIAESRASPAALAAIDVKPLILELYTPTIETFLDVLAVSPASCGWAGEQAHLLHETVECAARVSQVSGLQGRRCGRVSRARRDGDGTLPASSRARKQSRSRALRVVGPALAVCFGGGVASRGRERACKPFRVECLAEEGGHLEDPLCPQSTL